MDPTHTYQQPEYYTDAPSHPSHPPSAHTHSTHRWQNQQQPPTQHNTMDEQYYGDDAWEEETNNAADPSSSSAPSTHAQPPPPAAQTQPQDDHMYNYQNQQQQHTYQQQQQQQQQPYNSTMAPPPTDVDSATTHSQHPPSHSQVSAPHSSAPLSSSSSSTHHGPTVHSQQTHPLRPIVPSYLHSSGGGSTSAPPPAIVDPRATPEYQVAWELELWRRSEVTRLQAEWKAEEEKRMSALEAEWKRSELAREAQMSQKKAALASFEKKLNAGLFELQNQERLLRLREGELASRIAGLDREIANVRSDAELKSQRARDSAKHEIAKHKTIAEEVTQQNQVLKQKLNAAEAKVLAVQEEFHTYKGKINKTTTGELRLALQAQGVENKRLQEDLKHVSEERDQALQRLRMALDAAAGLKREIEMKQMEALELERKDMERLRLTYLQKQQSQGLRRDQQDMMDIKRDLRALMTSTQPPERKKVTDMPPFGLGSGETGAAATGGGGAGKEERFGTNSQPSWSKGRPFSATSSTSAMKESPLTHVPEFSAVSPSYSTFNPIPQTGTGGSVGRKMGVSSSHSGVEVSGRAVPSGDGQPEVPVSSLASLANSVPQPYHYLVHEQETLATVQAQRR